MRRTSYQHRGAIELPGFTRADCGREEGLFQDRRGSWRQRHNLAVFFLQLSDALRERGLEGLRHTEERGQDSFIPSFVQQPFNGLLPNQTWQPCGERDRASDHTYLFQPSPMATRPWTRRTHLSGTPSPAMWCGRSSVGLEGKPLHWHLKYGGGRCA